MQLAPSGAVIFVEKINLMILALVQDVYQGMNVVSSARCSNDYQQIVRTHLTIQTNYSWNELKVVPGEYEGRTGCIATRSQTHACREGILKD